MGRYWDGASLLSDHRSSDLGKQIPVGALGLPGAVGNRQASQMAGRSSDGSETKHCACHTSPHAALLLAMLLIQDLAVGICVSKSVLGYAGLIAVKKMVYNTIF